MQVGATIMAQWIAAACKAYIPQQLLISILAAQLLTPFPNNPLAKYIWDSICWIEFLSPSFCLAQLWLI